MHKNYIFLLSLVLVASVQAAVTKCVITNVPSASGTVHAVVTCASGDTLSNVRFGYTMLNGVPVGGNLTNYVNLTPISGTTNRLYTGVATSALPTGGSYWYWVEGKVGSGSVTNFCGQLLNQWRYLSSYGVGSASVATGTDWFSIPKNWLGEARDSYPVHKYSGWGGTNLCFDTGYSSVDFLNTNGLHLIGLRSPVFDSGMGGFSLRLAWNHPYTTNNMLVYVVTNDVLRASNSGQFSILSSDTQWVATNCLPVFTVAYPGAPGRVSPCNEILSFTNETARVSVGQQFVVWIVRDGFAWGFAQNPNCFIRIHEIQIVPPTAEIVVPAPVFTPYAPILGVTSVVSIATSSVAEDWPALVESATFYRAYGSSAVTTPMVYTNGLWSAFVTNSTAGVFPSWVQTIYRGFDSMSSALSVKTNTTHVTPIPVYSARQNPTIVNITLTDISYDTNGAITNCSINPPGLMSIMKRQFGITNGL